MNRLCQLSFVVAALLCSFRVASQTPYLERVVTIAFNEERMDDALKKISQQAGFTFSYNPNIIEAGKRVSFNFVNKTVREILDELFGRTIQYKSRGKYVILTRAELSSSKKEPQVYSGYVVDEATGERLKNVSIYDPVTLSSAVTDSYGYFEIEISKPPPNLRLAINKQNYTDTLIVPSGQGRLLNIPLTVNKEKINLFADSVGSKIKRFWKKAKVFTQQKVNMDNIRDTIHRSTQVSFVPFIGTNHALSGNVINDFSFNIIGGYSLGVEKFELGGVFNVVRGNVKGAQLAGTFNVVGGNVKRSQLAGVFNANFGSSKGAQLAGTFNFNWGHVSGLSAAGVINFALKGSKAWQLAGVANMSLKEQERPQLAGAFNFAGSHARTQLAGSYNFAGRDLGGWQGAGAFNFTGGNMHGAQTAGVFNITGKDVRGVQASGVFNIAGKELRGLQMAGVFNYAKSVRGAQLGLINIADSVRGVPIGLFSIVWKGYHKIEIAADEVFYSNVAFRTGVRSFYNILTVGARPGSFNEATTLWTFGYGVGTAPRISRKLFLNVDVTSNQIVQGNTLDALNMLNKAFVGIDYQIFPKMSLTFGATLNAHLTETSHEGYWDLFTDYQPEIFYQRDYSNDLTMKMWWGGKVGLRFL